ncbi:uncharacterized protein PITG_18759 [Phytophthora infestans T30-4]|uniref:Myosin motor domain-containing protein n=1 Tax=Phytophthora infestans (strain T30-4) TaxID=403677 RepID=D0NZ67_PHYIT|nr:uncharacterized protein PITG_18759 [Phytophthora infestans T30-4]EEY68854.1 conserved hypothetical protein [Phytophthora infestans T30-4]|eukprot:XP_002997404.1 conserved hypothetical protein [Phytophthora infestans T30-4]
MAQYQQLVQGICLAQEKSGSSEPNPDSILAEAFKLRYQFEEIPENQRKLSRDVDHGSGSAAKSAVTVGQVNSEEGIVNALSSRFDEDHIYTYVNHHMIIVMNPYRLLQTARFTSIYDEQVVLTYADTANAETVLAPHPFAIAKQSLGRGQSLCLCGGSGKTELAKDLLKYLVLVAQPALSEGSEGRQPKIKLFTSSTKSTIQMRTEETRTIALLEAKGVEKYEIVLLDWHPERWEEMASVSRSKPSLG